MAKKYSIILPYYKRPSLKSTLISFVHHYGNRNDYEVVIVEDSKNYEDQESHHQLLDIISQFNSRMSIIYCLDEKPSYNSARKYNVGYINSYGSYILLSNPETPHENNILGGLDEYFNRYPNDYVVCACRSCNLVKPIVDNFQEIFNNTMEAWYQHSEHRNAQFHFCSCLSRENFRRAGGFDERYCTGIAFEDDSMKQRIIRNGIRIINRDDLVSIHINHERDYGCPNKVELIERNRCLFNYQIVNNDFFEPNRINDRSISYTSM